MNDIVMKNENKKKCKKDNVLIITLALVVVGVVPSERVELTGCQ